MKQVIQINNTGPWCGFCAEGYMHLLQVEHDATPECEPKVYLQYVCNSCRKVLEIDIDDLGRYDNTIGIKTIFELCKKARGE